MKKVVLASLTALAMTGLMTSVSAQTIPQNENVMQLIPVSREEGEKIYKQIENDMKVNGIKRAVPTDKKDNEAPTLELIPVNREEGEKIYKQIENDMKVNGIKRAVPEENTNKELAAATQIFTFPFTFDSNLKSRDFKVNKTTLKITSAASWVSPETEKKWGGSDYDYYTITLYGNGKSYGTVVYDIGAGEQTGTFKDLKAGGTYYFYMSKHRLTWTDREQNGDITGNGSVWEQ
ncbi:hypothetical protein ABEV55_04795 [Aneurinibacillus thermoaerophilus]|uniref:hypothetical protein n=1 Tax=Aneurinibacillus thermoaerophilus TaxID=143495 RepID=UPI002E2456C7|nr:hypothetical protein [Aneurinibacillus thermoaerophilus]